MKYIFLMSLVLLTSNFSKANGDHFEKKIVGTWSSISDEGDHIIYSETTYFPDGNRCTVIIEYKQDKGSVYHISGKYTVENNFLTLYVDNTDDPYVKKNKVIKDEIVSITQEKMTLRSLDYILAPEYHRYKEVQPRNKIHCKFQP